MIRACILLIVCIVLVKSIAWHQQQKYVAYDQIDRGLGVYVTETENPYSLLLLEGDTYHLCDPIGCFRGEYKLQDNQKFILQGLGISDQGIRFQRELRGQDIYSPISDKEREMGADKFSIDNLFYVSDCNGIACERVTRDISQFSFRMITSFEVPTRSTPLSPMLKLLFFALIFGFLGSLWLRNSEITKRCFTLCAVNICIGISILIGLGGGGLIDLFVSPFVIFIACTLGCLTAEAGIRLFEKLKH